MLTYLLDQDASGGSVAIDGNIATFVPDADINGSTSFSYKVTDGELLSSSATVEVTVNPVNDTPVLDSISDQETDEDITFTYDVSASDVDGDDLSYSISIDGNGDASIDGTAVSYTHLTLPTKA